MAHEETPLLDPHDTGPDQSRVTPLPKLQLFLLYFATLSEPVAFSLVFPFINQEIKELGITNDSRKVGYYAGFVESVFSIAQLATVLQWGRISDRIGRKPVVVLGLGGVTISALLFGLSKSLFGLLASRALAGCLNGNVAVLKSMLGEITDETNMGQAFSYMPLCWSLGAILGPLIGGYLSHPVEKLPHLFGSSEFLREYPYFLPCAAGALFPLLAVVLSLLFMEETLPKNMPHVQQEAIFDPLGSTFSAYLGELPENATRPSTYLDPPSTNPNASSFSHLSLGSSLVFAAMPAAKTGHAALALPPPHVSDYPDPDRVTEGCSAIKDQLNPAALTMSSLLTVQVLSIVGNWSLQSLISTAFDSSFPVFAYTKIEDAGLSFSESRIGAVLGGLGLFTGCIQILLFPTLQRRIGTVRLYRFAYALWPVIWAVFPLLSVTARHFGEDSFAFWLLMAVWIFARAITDMNFACLMILVTTSSPSRAALGTLNGLVQSAASAMRTLAPAGATSLYAASVSQHALGGYLYAVVGVIISIFGAVMAMSLHEKGRAGGWMEGNHAADTTSETGTITSVRTHQDE